MNNEEVIKLAELNQKMNSFNEISNVKQVFSGNRDMRDPIIDRLMTGADVYYRIDKLAREMSKHYFETYGNDIDFTYFIDFIEQIVRILLKNLKVFDEVKDPRAFMISYLFKQKVGTFDNRIWAYFNRYYPKYFVPFKNHKSYEHLLDKSKYCKDDIDFCESNKFYVDYYESGVNGKDTRDLIRDDDIELDEENNYKDPKIEAEEIEEENLEWYAEDNSVLSIADDNENHSVFKNPIITSFDIPYEKYKADNIALSDEEYGKQINEIRDKKLRKWHIYNAESGYFPHNITRYRAGVKYFEVRKSKKKARKNKNPEYIYAVCEPVEFDFSEIFFDKKTETYLKNIIIKNLSKRQQLLIGYLYYKMIPVDDVVELMGFSSRKVLNQEKNRSLEKLRRKILNDYDYIVQEYDETKLVYWAKKTKHRHENICAKKEEKMLSI